MATSSTWNGKQTDQSADVVRAFRTNGFRKIDAYRYNSVSIRVRVIDKRFKGKTRRQRMELAEKAIQTLPEKTQADIIFLLLLTPEEAEGSLINLEFEDPSPSRL
jgi:hypothetical protein